MTNKDDILRKFTKTTKNGKRLQLLRIQYQQSLKLMLIFLIRCNSSIYKNVPSNNNLAPNIIAKLVLILAKSSIRIIPSCDECKWIDWVKIDKKEEICNFNISNEDTIFS